MINKKNLLGKIPDELGLKDAIHVAIVSVRAKGPIAPGTRCAMNADREAIESANGPGIADPFLKNTIQTGQAFWLLLNQDEVPNVRHVWDHPTVDFSPPANPVKKNRTLQSAADHFGVSYEEILTAAAYVVEHRHSASYMGSKTALELKNKYWESYDFWSEWAAETGYEFYNNGSECCPEYDYPECSLFEGF